MPGAATHLAIADKLYALWGAKKIPNLPLFFCGNLAPDAVYAKPGFTRADKRHSHLTVDIPIDAFHDPVKLCLFRERLNAFLREFCVTESASRDLYIGYAVHLMADELVNVTLRTPFNRLMFRDGVPEAEKELFERVMKDIDGADKLVFARFPYRQDVIAACEAAWDYEVPGYVGAAELNNSKRYVLGKLRNPAPPVMLTYYDYEEAVQFIDYAAQVIAERLSGISGFVPVFG